MSDKATQKGLRDQLGDGYLNLLDSVRHSFEQAAWGQETSGDLSADFYRWAGAEPAQAAEPADGAEVVAPEKEDASDKTWAALEAWIDGKLEAQQERTVEAERGKDGPEIGD